jgi:hypothetical protein
MKKIQFFFPEKYAWKNLGFGCVHQNIFFLFENVLNFFLKYFGENRVF